MLYNWVSFVLILTAPVAVSACEGECIVGITNAFLGNYSFPIHQVMEQMATKISDMMPNHPPTQTTMGYLRPLLDAYKKNSYAGMETAIFPSYFHGKCQLDGVDPPGCPNPDCPVVCGTPGSLVHFYPKLRYIAYNQTGHTLKTLSTPDTEIYKQVEKNILKAAAENEPSSSRRMIRIYARSSPFGSTALSLASRQDQADLKTKLKTILAEIGPLLEQVCGGTGDGETHGLQDCSWEARMKEYILTFP